jgi:succinate dehydrogenase/fumarate reductase flavoprotein subunit
LRDESRGAHQREDHPRMDPAWRVNQVLALERVEPAGSRAAGLTAKRHEVAA